MKGEVKVALTIFVAIFVAFIGYRFMADVPLFTQTYQLYAEFERVDGVIPGSSIFLQGVKIGTVSDVTFQPNDSVRVGFSLNLPGKLPEKSVAYIRSTSILEKGIEIKRGSSTTMLESGSRIKGIYDDGFLGALEDLSSETGPHIVKSTESLSSLLSQIDEMMLEGGRRDIEESLTGLNQTIHQVEDLFRSKNTEIREAITSLRNTLQNVEDLSDDQKDRINNIMESLETSGREFEELAADMNRATGTLNNVLEKIDRGDGSLGMLINDPSLYNNLDSLSYNLARLVKELNENPRHFLKHVRLIELF
jgi:phospholipid/cholesterol/gamma-HCH transport system substrate-binding protein